MLYADDFREIARNALRGKWGLAIGTGFIALLFDVSIFSGNNWTKRIERVDIRILTQFRPFFITLFSILFLLGIISLFFGGAIELGYCRFNKNLVNNTNPQFNDLFSKFDIFWKACGTHIIIILYTFFWTLLFIVPGIIASLSYAMTPYILEDNPSMGINEAIQHSKDMMSGIKWRLFCLNFSFIGWMFLSIFTLGLGYLWLNAYMSAAHAAFIGLPDDFQDGYDNVTICTTIENQLRANERLSILKELPIKHKIITIQPMLEKIDILDYLDNSIECVIVGGESGSNVRPLDYNWVLDIRKQCIKKNVSFEFRQLGSIFIKNSITYKVSRQNLCAQARKADINYFRM